MTKLPVITLAIAALAGAASAQTAPFTGANLPAAGPRARGPALGPAVAAAEAAVAACKAQGYVVSALIVDSIGNPVVLLSGDGATFRTQYVAGSKAAAVIKYKVASGVMADRAKADPKIDAELKADPAIGGGRQGGVPIMSGTELIGALAISGAPGGDKDEACAMAALAKVPLK